MAAFDFPNSPSTNQTYTANGMTFIWNGSVWKKDATAGVKGAKGDAIKGDKGQKGEKGDKGVKGDKGTKGQKGEIGPEGGSGGVGDKGNQGDKGDKGTQGDIVAATFNVTNNGASNYIIDGQNNPTLKLVRGFRYHFSVNVSGHPFWIKTSATTGTSNAATGVTNNGAQTGTIIFEVPLNAPATLYYICQYHGSMVGTINVVDNGEKGNKGDKGQKGEDNSTKGQKGQTGADNSTKGQKGQKGQTGADNSTKGQKGEVGNQGTPAISNESSSTYRNLVFIDSSSATTIKTNDNNRLQVRSSDGALRVAGDITAFYSSDINLKENITPIPNALDKIIAISGNTFTWKADTGFDYLDNKQDTGVIAQEIEALGLPGITTTRDNGVKAVRYERLVPILIEAIKELKKEINEIKNTE